MFDVVNSRRDLLTRNLTHHAHPSIQAQHLQLCSGNLQRRDMLASGRRRPVLISSSGTAQKEPAHGGIVKKTSQRKERRAACESWCWSAGPGICLAPEHGSAAGWSSLPLRWGRQARAQGRGGLFGLVWCASCPEAEILRLSRELREEGKKTWQEDWSLCWGRGGLCFCDRPAPGWNERGRAQHSRRPARILLFFGSWRIRTRPEYFNGLLFFF